MLTRLGEVRSLARKDNLFHCACEGAFTFLRIAKIVIDTLLLLAISE